MGNEALELMLSVRSRLAFAFGATDVSIKLSPGIGTPALWYCEAMAGSIVERAAGYTALDAVRDCENQLKYRLRNEAEKASDALDKLRGAAAAFDASK